MQHAKVEIVKNHGGVPAAGEVDAAIARAQRYACSRQLAKGAWPGSATAGPDATAEALIALAHAGALDGDHAARARSWLAAQQLPDGSFEAYEGQGEDQSQGKRDQTAIVYAALMAAGEDPRAPVARKAWAFIHAQGGFRACDLYARILLSAVGLISPDDLPDWPLDWVLVPGATRLLGTALAPAFTFMLHVTPAIIRGFKARGRVPDPRRHPIAAASRRSVLEYLARHQNPTGNFFGALNTTVMGILCYRALGLDASDPRLMRAIDDLGQWSMAEGDGVRYAIFDSQVWHTALMISTLCEGGLCADDQAVARGLHFLVTRQSYWTQPSDWQNPTWGTPRTGGWAFEDCNPLAPDCDTTGEVLGALGHVREPDSRIRHAIHRGVAWLFGMQNADGGWPSFTRGHRGKQPGPFALSALEQPGGLIGSLRMLATPPVQFRDPSIESLTGRVLQGLGQLGYTKEHERVARAIAFLRAQRCDSGVWWGRWECNYLAGTAEVLSGLASVGEDMNDPLYSAAIAWVKQRQNPDGGWGEGVDSYENPALAGMGETSTYLTGIVASALIACGQAGSHEVQRAVRYLLDTQDEHGSWPSGSYQFTVQWPWPFYRLELTPALYGLKALTAYRRARAGSAA
jgi:squalene-hopene/tetraprenyl-beta-curcumene cyclase